MQFKELTIKRPRGKSLPTLDLQGRWLETLGFTIGKIVNVGFHDSCLTLSTNPIISKNPTVIQVTSKFVRKQPRTCLVLNWWLLKKYGFNMHDRIVLQLAPNFIQISKINFYSTD